MEDPNFQSKVIKFKQGLYVEAIRDMLKDGLIEFNKEGTHWKLTRKGLLEKEKQRILRETEPVFKKKEEQQD